MWRVLIETTDDDIVSVLHCNSLEKAEALASLLRDDVVHLIAGYHWLKVFKVTVEEDPLH